MKRTWGGGDVVLPNVSYVKDGEVYYNPFVDVVEPMLLTVGNTYPELGMLVNELYQTYHTDYPVSEGGDRYNRHVYIAFTDNVPLKYEIEQNPDLFKAGDVLIKDNGNFIFAGNIKSDKKFNQLFELYINDKKLDSIHFDYWGPTCFGQIQKGSADYGFGTDYYYLSNSSYCMNINTDGTVWEYIPD